MILTGKIRIDGQWLFTRLIVTLTAVDRCEYILYRGVYRTSYARISRGIITDTELQVGQFMLPKHGFNVTDDSESARYSRAFKEEMQQDLVSHTSPFHLRSISKL